MPTYTCSVCFELFHFNQMVKDLPCHEFHHFCQSCLKSAMEISLVDGNIPIKCLVGDCQNKVLPNVAEKYLELSKGDQYRQLHDQESLGLSFPCPACAISVIGHNNFQGSSVLNLDFTKVTCPNGHEICSHCHCDFHHGISCHEFQLSEFTGGSLDILFVDFCRNRKFQRCPGCKMWVEKLGGCNDMTCSCCHSQFCYHCGSNCLGTHQCLP